MRVVHLRRLFAIALLGLGTGACEEGTDPRAAELLAKVEAAQEHLSWNAEREIYCHGSTLAEYIEIRAGRVETREALRVDGVPEADLSPEKARRLEEWERMLESGPARYRYAEFFLHGDAERLLTSYVPQLVVDESEEPRRQVIAGRSCVRIDLEPRRAGSRLTFHVWVEPETGLVLGYERFDWNGQLIDRMNYLKLDLIDTSGSDHDLGGDGSSSDLDGALAYLPLEIALERVSFPVMLPRYVPEGFTNYKTAILSFANPPVPLKHEAALIAEEYLLHSMTDGVNLLFIVSLPDTGDGTRNDLPADLTDPHLDRVVVSRFPLEDGSGLTAFAIRGESVATFIIGQLSEEELITIVESLEFVR